MKRLVPALFLLLVVVNDFDGTWTLYEAGLSGPECVKKMVELDAELPAGFSADCR